MKSIIASLFTIYALASATSKRLLLQAQTAAPVATWTPVVIPNGNAPSYSTTMECLLPNTNPMGCAGRITTLQNAGNNFKLKCGVIGSCAASTLNFTYVNSHAERVEYISCSEQFACYGAKVIMDSTQSLTKQYIDKFECKAPGACDNCVVQLIGGATINDVNCPDPAYCQNCKIEACTWDPNYSGQLLCGPSIPCFQ